MLFLLEIELRSVPYGAREAEECGVNFFGCDRGTGTNEVRSQKAQKEVRFQIEDPRLKNPRNHSREGHTVYALE
jgi:hypothetical protein